MLWLAQLERQYLADRQAFGVAALLEKDTDTEPRSWDERQQAFDAALAGENVSAETGILAELGIAA